MKTLAKKKLLQNGHIRLVSGRATVTIDLDNNNTYTVYGDCYGSTNKHTIDRAISKVFNHLPAITKII